MPYAFATTHKASLLPHADKRIKLMEEDKAHIRALHAEGVAVRAIARLYKERCSRRLIQFVLFPERLEVNARQFAERQKDGRYYNRKRHTEYMRRHRRRKQALLKKGIVSIVKTEGRRITRWRIR